MVSEDELLNGSRLNGTLSSCSSISVLKSTLEKNGEYGKLKAELQVQLMRTLGLDKQLKDSQKPECPSRMAIANQIVHEYLNWAGFKFTDMIFSAEAPEIAPPTPRNQLCEQLNIKDSYETEQLPLLLTMISSVKR